MAVILPDAQAAVLRQFRTTGSLVRVAPHGSGHINHSYSASFEANGRIRRYLLQRVNTGIFKQPELLMENMQRVTLHLAGKLAGQRDADRRVLTLVPTHDGHAWHRDAEGGVWRVFVFLENAFSYDLTESPSQAFEAAKAFGSFGQQLADLPAPRLHETISAFHDTPRRLRDLEQAIAHDAAHRVSQAATEIRFVRSRQSTAPILTAANLPERVTHNDTKLNNVLFDSATGQALCVVDLDTVMPGLALYDFGDMVRTATSPTAEDEQDLSRVEMRFPMFEALVRGYLASASSYLTREEKEHLPACGKVIAYEQGIRFLADYLAGDMYYKVTRSAQNLDRCRTQFKLVESIEQQESAMERLVQTI